MESSSGGAMANDSMAELFGPFRRRPLLSNTLRTLSRIYSLFPEENPFSDLADCTHTPAVWQACNAHQRVRVRPISDGVGDDSVPRSEKEDSIQLDGPGSLEFKNLPICDEQSNEGTAEVLCKDNGVNGSEVIIDELNGGKETETADKVGSNLKDTSDHMAEVHQVPQGLVGIERILMDESDDLGLLQMSDKDVNFDILKDFGSFMDNHGFGNNCVPVEHIGNGTLPVEGRMKEDVVVENKGKDMEAKNSTSGGNTGQSPTNVPIEREKYGSSEVDGASPQAVGMEAKVSRRKVPQNLSEIGGLTFSAKSSKNEGGTVSGGKAVNSIEKGHKSKTADKGKTKKSKKASLKDAKSGKRKRISVDGGGSKKMKSGRADSVADGKIPELNVQVNKESSSAKLVHKHGPIKGEKIQYTREQLMHLREPLAVPKDILEVVKEISAQLHGEEKSRVEAATDTIRSHERQSAPCLGDKKVEEKDASVCGKGQLAASTVDANEKEMVSDILKKKRRGSSSETRKEKKKQKRRKKRAELNKKLGVKRLKLKPILKPKVVPHCRHYLKGRCQEGEKCKFSHDVIPLTKSKPCCHFARHTCMKGDDCPFDHQLSKYPCNNYVETGFCSRGDSCLFSHKVQVKEGSETVVGVSKSPTCPLNQLDKSNSTQQLIASVSSSGTTTMKNLKENSAPQINRPAKALKGVSFLSFGKSSLDNSAKTKVDISQPDVDAARTGGQTTLAVPVGSGNTMMSIPVSPTPQRVGFLPPKRSLVDSSGTKSQASAYNVGPSGQPNLTWTNFPSSPTPQVSSPPVERNSVDGVVPKSLANVDVAGTNGQHPTVQGRAIQLCKTLVVDPPASPKPRGASFLAFEKVSADISGSKNQASRPSPCVSLLNEPTNIGQVASAHQVNQGTSSGVLDGSGRKLWVGPSSDGHYGSIGNRSASELDKLKAVHSEPWGSTTSGQCSSRASGPVKSSPITARTLLSTLAFAAKYESRIKMGAAAANEFKRNEGTSGTGCKQNESIKASDILESLYGGGHKEKQ